MLNNTLKIMEVTKYMRVTRQLATRLYDSGIVTKKKHRQASISLKEWHEYCNMINVLNTVRENETSINGYLLSEFFMPSQLTDLIMPWTLSLSGDAFGSNLLESSYIDYSPWNAGYVGKDLATKLWSKKRINAEGEVEEYLPNFREILGSNPNDNFEIQDFRCFLNPIEFKRLGTLLHGNFKVTAGEAGLVAVNTLKVYKSLSSLETRLSPLQSKCAPRAEFYVPVITDCGFMKMEHYVFDTDIMMDRWFCIACDNIIAGMKQQIPTP